MRIDNRTLVLGFLAAAMMSSAALMRGQSQSHAAAMFLAQQDASTQEFLESSGTAPQPAMAAEGRAAVAGLRWPEAVELGRTLPGDADVRRLLREIQTSDSEEARTEAQIHLRDLLGKQFKEDVARRQQELNALEERLDDMQTKLTKRIDSADQIIDLRMQVLMQDVDGLGWSGNATGSVGQASQPVSTPQLGWETYYIDSVDYAVVDGELRRTQVRRPVIRPAVPGLRAETPSKPAQTAEPAAGR